MKTFLKRRPIYVGGSIIIILIILFFATLSSGSPRGRVVAVHEGPVVTEVLLTGVVKANQSVSLSFERSGRIQNLSSLSNTPIARGTLLAAIEAGTEEAALAEARAQALSAESAVREITEGTRPEELKVKEAEFASRETSLASLTNKTDALIADAHDVAEETLNRYADPFFIDDTSAAPRLSFGNGTQDAYDAEAKRIEAAGKLERLQTLITDTRDAEVRLTETRLALRMIHGLYITLGETLRSGNLDEATLTDYRERLATGRGKLVDALLSIQNHMNAIAEARASLLKAERELTLSRSGATSEERNRKEQELSQAEARVRGAEAAVRKTQLRAPFAGRIVSRHVELGETISAGGKIIDFQGVQGFAIEAQVPEADVTKLRTGASAKITLDAFGSDLVLDAEIVSIEPGEVLIDGVPTYKTTLSFKDTPIFLRSGMTANITLPSILKEKALLIPQEAIIEEGKEKTVRIADEEKTERAVVTGKRSANGMIEIVEGLRAGETILISN